MHAALSIRALSDPQEFVEEFVVHQIIKYIQRYARRIEDPAYDQAIVIFVELIIQ